METLRYIFLAHIADDSAKVPEALERIPKWREAIAMAEEIAAEKPCLSLSALAISGNDLRKFEEPSPKYGKVLNELLKQVVEGVIPNEREILLEKAKEMFIS